MIFQKSYTPSSGFRNELLCCFPTDVDYYESDYQAVMDSKESLREWSRSEWPEDSFTMEQNKEDLQLHVDDNLSHSAYGYMLYNSDKTQCLGSVYVNPVDSLKEYYTFVEGSDSLLDTMDARIEYWIRDCPSNQFLEISKVILHWIQTDWNIRACFTARESMSDRMAIYKILELTESLVVKNNDDGHQLHIFTRPPAPGKRGHPSPSG